MRGLKQYGWVVPAYTLPPNEKEKVILRCVIREQHSEDIVSHLFNHLMKVMDFLQKHSKKPQGSKKEENDQKHHTFNSVC